VTTTPATEELLTHGAREAAQALVRLLRLPVVVGDVVAQAPAALAAQCGPGAVVAITFDTSGGVVGTLALVIDDGIAARLAARLMGQDAHGGALGPTQLAALAELGNIAASAFLNGAARVVRRACLPSVPRVGHAPAATLLAALLPDAPFAAALLRVDDQPVRLLFCAGGTEGERAAVRTIGVNDQG